MDLIKMKQLTSANDEEQFLAIISRRSATPLDLNRGTAGYPNDKTDGNSRVDGGPFLIGRPWRRMV
jgi:hypothetical protein